VTRRAVAVLGAAALALAAAAPAGAAPPHLAARAAFLVEPELRDVAYALHPDQRRPIASTTKLMTALVALGRLELDRLVTVAPYAATAGESLIGLRTGERMTFADLLRAMMLPSANDAAHAVAVAVGGSVPAFVRLMNQRAKQLGLRDTHYSNPVGLDEPGNYSSARDLVEMALLLRRNPFIRRIVDEPRAVLRSGSHPRVVVNRNDLVARYPYVNGVKTGHTLNAGYVLVGSATGANGVTVLSAVLGDPSIATRDADSLALLRYGLSLYRRVTPVHAGQRLAEPRVDEEGSRRAPLVASTAVSALARRGVPIHLHVIGAPKKVSGPLPAGRRIGAVEVVYRGRVVGRTALVTSRSVPRPSVPQRVRAWLGHGSTLLLLAFLAVCTVLLVVLRRRVLRTRRAPRKGEDQ
jgi:D-alanyl-D-alanine carboxypeptidase (penicillin-binding protein 5/6)